MKLSNVIRLNEIISLKASSVIDIKLAYKIVKLNRHIDPDVRFYYETRQKLLNELASKNEDGTFKIENDNYSFTDENQTTFNEKMTELVNTEVDIPDTLKFTLDELKDLELSVSDVFILEPIITEK